jgi:hypothetical protein
MVRSRNWITKPEIMERKMEKEEDRREETGDSISRRSEPRSYGGRNPRGQKTYGGRQ